MRKDASHCSVQVEWYMVWVCMQGVKGDVNKLFLKGTGARDDLRAFLERQHPGVPSALFDPNAPAPWRSSPSHVRKPFPEYAAHMAGASVSALKEGSPQRCAGHISQSQLSHMQSPI